MSIELLHKLEKASLFFIIIFLPITGMPQKFSISMIGKTLPVYFLIIGVLLMVYEYYKYKTPVNKIYTRYFCIFIVWQLLCLAIGLYTYEYNEYLSLSQSPKLLIIAEKLSNYGLIIDELLLLKSWLFLRFSKDIIFTSNCVLILAFLIWHIYHSNWQLGFYEIRKMVLSLVLLMGAYSIIELVWLKMGLPSAELFLRSVNVFLYDPETAHGWWPPLLWWGQLRSLCHEPSYFGIISIMCLPFIWSYVFENKYRIFTALIVCYYGLMIAATNARTAIIVTFGQFILLIMLSMWLNKRDWIKPIITIFLCMAIGFALNIVNIKAMLGDGNAVITEDIGKYAEKNIISITKKDSRSNSARLANMIANYETIKDYPFFGVGYGLKDAYIDARLPEFAYSNYEVRNWSRYMHKEGVLKSGYPALNKYLDVAVKNGLIGLFLYLIPVFYLLYGFFQIKGFMDYRNITVMVAFIGLLVSQLSNADLIICNGITWGLMWCMIATNGLTNNWE